jgi:hypothetical protein
MRMQPPLVDLRKGIGTPIPQPNTGPLLDPGCGFSSPFCLRSTRKSSHVPPIGKPLKHSLLQPRMVTEQCQVVLIALNADVLTVVVLDTGDMEIIDQLRHITRQVFAFAICHPLCTT